MPRRVTQATIPEPYEDTRSLYTSVKALKELVETLAGQRGLTDVDAAVTWAGLREQLPVVSDAGVFKISSGEHTVAAPTTAAVILPPDYRAFEIYVKDGDTSVGSNAIGMEFSWDGGATWPAAANQYQNIGDQMNTSNAAGAWAGFAAANPAAWLSYSQAATGANTVKLSARATLNVPATGNVMSYFIQSIVYDGTQFRQVRASGFSALVANMPNRMRFKALTGNIVALRWQVNGVK